MATSKKFAVRCRAIIVHDGKLLVVKHAPHHKHVALPGGHLEWDETVLEAIKREVIEELGVTPDIGRLLYINTFTNDEETHSTEFFFEVKNGADFLDIENRQRSHAHEVCEMFWMSQEDDLNLLPQPLKKYFKEGNLFTDIPRFIQG